MPVLLPLGALLLAGSLSAMAQTNDSVRTFKAVVVREKVEAPEGKDALQATETTFGKGRQILRDIPQSVAVVTEKLIVDRNLDTVKEALKTPAASLFWRLKAEKKTFGCADCRCKPPATSSYTACAIRRFTSGTPSTWAGWKCCAARPPCCLGAAPLAVL